MINFYQVWKENKEATPKNKKAKGQYKCKLCGKRVNGLKDHVEGFHGKGSWTHYISAEAEIFRQETEAFKNAFEQSMGR